ncbi:hypothetical protein Pmani_003331 [Petrolisthes manimaculis]|uniref:Large ribosomal subunit protein mL49 n=1 Tax=Petrolisthes manimaculis TaxID=1843537 RepID=A0AAE1UIK0_9EUCA|nr:hypothetical protein Pmani_003331 [Petrolisthes manimaculis]
MSVAGRTLFTLQRCVCMRDMTKVAAGVVGVKQKHEGLVRFSETPKALLHTTTSSSFPSFGTDRLPRAQHSIPESYEQVEKSTAEWAYVERLFPPKSIPKPIAKPGEVMPSGWKSPSACPGDYSYFVHRSPSHLYPVYIKHTPMRCRYITKLHHIEGDIFALAEDLRVYLMAKRQPRLINMRVHEPHQKIHIKGQYVAEIREFLQEKGF